MTDYHPPPQTDEQAQGAIVRYYMPDVSLIDLASICYRLARITGFTIEQSWQEMQTEVGAYLAGEIYPPLLQEKEFSDD